jgi:hypothetical protein
LWFSLFFLVVHSVPAARLGHEAVDEAVERSESWGAAEVGGTSLGWPAGSRGPALWDWRVLMAAVSILVELFIFICPYQTRAL